MTLHALGVLLLAGPLAGLGSFFDSAALAGLPSGREPWSLLRTGEAAVTADRIESGGLFLGAPALFAVHGGSWTETTWRLGDADVTDPDRGGRPLVVVPAEALAGLTLGTALEPAATGGAGAHVSMAPRRAAEAWKGSLALAVTPSGLNGSGDGVAPPIATLSGWDDVALTAAGPATPRLGISAAGRFTRSERTERDSGDRLETRSFSVLGHGVLKSGDRDEWRLLAAGSGVDRPFAGRARLADPTAREEERAAHAQVTFARTADAGTGWRATAAFQHFTETPPAADGGAAVIERLRDGPVPELYASRRRIGRLDVAASVTPAGLRLGGRNVATLGVALERSSATWSAAGGASTGRTAETVGEEAARVWDFASGEARGRATHVALFADDRLALGGDVEVEAGLRVAAWRAGGISWTTASPRAAAQWKPASAVALFVGVERVHPRLPLRALQWGDPGAPQGRVHRWDDDGDRVFEATEQGPLVAVVGPGGPHAAVDGDLRSPHTDGLVAGFDLRPGGSWWIRFAGVRRRARDLVESVATGVTAADYTVTYLDDPAVDIVGPGDDRLLPVYARDPASFGQDAYLLTNVPEHDVLHEGVELTVEKRVLETLLLRIGGTASRSTGQGASRGYGVLENDPGTVGELFEDPNAGTHARGRLFFDRAYTLKVAALWRPRDWSLGVVANYQDGQPFARVVIVPGLPQGAEGIPAIRRGDHRFTYTLTVDARLERSARIGGARVAGVVEAFNLLDMKNEVEEDVTWGPSFRRVTAIQPPRAVRLGLRLEL